MTADTETRENPDPYEWLRKVADSALDGIITLDGKGRVIGWNRQAEVIFGWSRPEATGATLADLILPPEDRDAHQGGLRRFIETGESTDFLNVRREITALRRDGRPFPIEIAITPARIENVVIFTVFLRDITDRRRYEEWLTRRATESELLYRATALAAESDSFEEALRGCIAIVCQIMEWPIGHALVPDRDRTAVVSTGIWHSDDPVAGEALRGATDGVRFTPGFGLPGRIWQSAEPMWAEPAPEDATFPRVAAALSVGVKGGFGFPIKVNGRVVAILEFFRKEEGEPDPGLLLMARVIAAQVGRLIERRMAEEHRQLLLNELTHRVKNTLAVVSAIANQTLRTSPSPQAFTQSFLARLRALAGAHNLLTAGHWEGTDLHSILKTIVTVHSPSGEGVQVEGPFVSVRPRAAVSLSLLFHELATNAAKYGALSVPGGRVAIAWRPGEDERLHLEWRETGGPRLDQAPERQGYGSTLIRMSVERELNGEITMTYMPEGLLCGISLPWHSDRAEIGALETPILTHAGYRSEPDTKARGV